MSADARLSWEALSAVVRLLDSRYGPVVVARWLDAFLPELESWEGEPVPLLPRSAADLGFVALEGMLRFVVASVGASKARAWVESLAADISAESDHTDQG